MRELAKPFVKWVGGKRQLIPEIKNRLPKSSTIKTYYEPFLGGGAVLLDIQPKRAIVNDYNKELITAYQVIKNNIDELIIHLKTHKNEEEYFYNLREKDRTEEYSDWTDVQKASRLIYLNKTCYNGLYRVNSQGYFNTPFGRYKNPNIVNEFVLRELNAYFNESEIIFLNEDFESALPGVKKGDFVYFDPPYAAVSSTSNYTGYTAGGFDETEQERLRDLCDSLNERGVRFMLSNANVELIQELYNNRGYTIDIVGAKRSINSVGSRRGEVEEVLIYNY